MSTKLKFGTDADLQEILEAEKELGSIGTNEAAEAYAGMEGLEAGKVVTGKISQVNDQEVLVDVNFKSEGVISRNEFKEGEIPEVGSEIEVFIEKLEDDDGRLVLSKQKADFVRVWERIHQAFENNEIVRGTLTKRIKGGVVVDLFGIDAFLPGSQIDLRQIPDINALIGQDFDLKVIKVNKARRNIVVSRRVVLEEQRNSQRDKVLDTLDKGQVRKGIVKNITDFGAFIDLGGVDGLLHITDMSYKRISHPSEIVKLGDEVEVMVLDFNDKKERISLGMKQLKPHPWKDVAARYPEGMVVKGKVVSITDYGAFVEIKDGVDGLIHVSDMSWTKKINHPSEMVKKGDKVECVVLAVDKEKRRISLSMKHLTEDPWDSVEKAFPVDSEVKGKIVRLLDRGVVVELPNGLEGFIPVSKLTAEYIKVPADAFKVGDEVPAAVTEIDQNNRKIYLSVVDYFKNRESAELKAWMDSHKPGENGTTIAEAVAPAKKSKKSEEEA